MSNFPTSSSTPLLSSRPIPASPPPAVVATFDIESHRSPLRYNVSLFVPQPRVFITGSYTKLLRRHFLAHVALDLSRSKVVSVGSMRVSGKVSALVMLDGDSAAAIVDGTLSFFDLKSQTVRCAVHEFEEVTAIAALDSSSILSFSSSAAYVVDIKHDNSHSVQQLDQPVSSHISCAYKSRFATLHDDKVYVWEKSTLRAESFEHGIQAKPTGMFLNDKWLLIHVPSRGALFAYDAQNYRLHREVSFRPKQPSKICVRLVGDLVFWNDLQVHLYKDLPSLTLGVLDIIGTTMEWSREYTTCLSLRSRLPPFEVLQDATVLVQTSDFVFERYELPHNVAQLVALNVRQPDIP